MHPSRRRKKRPNYGIRTLEVSRGSNGFGFTISGQQPCILSCIVANSPADQAGLRAGDFLMSVNGISVSKITHDAVVNLIGNCPGPIKMTIAENYYSDSSDEEFGLGRMAHSRKPKYVHKPRTRRNVKDSARRALETAAHCNVNGMKMNDFIKHRAREVQINGNLYKEEPKAPVAVPAVEEGGPIEYKVLIGYLGTIEMPKQVPPNSRLQTICSCVKKLRQEKRSPMAILMTILPTCLTLKNSCNNILAIYPTNRIIYVGSSSERDSRYFGLVTSAVCDLRTNDLSHENYQPNEKKINNTSSEIEISNSCHVFVTDPKIFNHSAHAQKAELFNIKCTIDAVSGSCLEFPSNASYIVNLIEMMYNLQQSCLWPSNIKTEKSNMAPVVANSPQPSASSNSDSGIGFRDDCANITDRILLVEFPTRRVAPGNPYENINQVMVASNMAFERLQKPLNNCLVEAGSSGVRNIQEPSIPNNLSKSDCFEISADNRHLNNLNNIKACESTSIKNDFERSSCKSEYLIKQNNNRELFNSNNLDTYSRLTCRAMPDPCPSEQLYQNLDNDENMKNYSDRLNESPDKKSLHSINDDLDFKSSTDNISMHSTKSAEDQSIFKTPMLVECHKSVKGHLKLTSSCDSIDKYNGSLLNYKLSPKVHGLMKPLTKVRNYERVSDFESGEKLGHGSLQELNLELGSVHWNVEPRNLGHITQSEPDVRINSKEMQENLTCDHNRHAKSENSDGAKAWSRAFEKLLEDPLGLHTFAEFLKKEFSAENIYFWTACERYRQLPDGPERREEARRIYGRHLCVGAPEPVNVDARGRHCTERALDEAHPGLFESAQKQIYNLMKFDSYPRFLKSNLYKECLNKRAQEENDMDQRVLHRATGSSPSKLKKSLSNAEERSMRKSLLRWHKKSRSKSKDRDNDAGGGSNSEGTHWGEKKGFNDIHSSRSSLTSLDLAVSGQDCGKSGEESSSTSGRTALCRVILSNGSTTVVQIKESDTVQELVNRLLTKRGLNYSSFEVHTDKHSKTVDISEPSTKLAGCEVTVEQRVIFKLELPNRKVISVKSKYTKRIVDVLRPILRKYNYNLDCVKVTRSGSEILNLDQQVTEIDNMRLTILLRSGVENVSSNNLNPNIELCNSRTKKVNDEITNQVFEGILQKKATSGFFKVKSDGGSIKSEDCGSDSSGILGKVLRRDASQSEKKKKYLLPRLKSSNEDINENTHVKKPLIAKLKAGVNKFQVACSESDELVEGLTRAQRARLEDQRGTEINFELPDFLKDKENRDQPLVNHPLKQEQTSVISSAKNIKLNLQSNHETSPNMQTNLNATYSQNINMNQAKKLNNLRAYSPDKINDRKSVCSLQKHDNGELRISDPPPLPPKPKIIPMKPSNWGQNGFCNNQKENDGNSQKRQYS